MSDTVYTIGYSGYILKDFICTLEDNEIALVVDVRSVPYSKRFPDYNKDTLSKTLRIQGFHYRNYDREFGAQIKDRGLYNYHGGYVDFEKVANAEAFKGGVERLCNAMKEGYTFALICAEKDPAACHRGILIARAFHEREYTVRHLLPGGSKLSQEELEFSLLQAYFPERAQTSLFGDNPQKKDIVAESYRMRNAEIGYKGE